MKSKDQQLLEEAYELVSEGKYTTHLKANPKKINLKSAAALLSQESGLDETLVYLDLVKTLDEWDLKASWDYGTVPADTSNPERTFEYIMELSAAKDTKDLDDQQSQVINFYRAAKLPLAEYRKLAQVLQQTPKQVFKKYAQRSAAFWDEHYELASEQDNS